MALISNTTIWDTALSSMMKKMNLESESDFLALKPFTVYKLAVDQKPLYLSSVIFYADRCKHTNSFISMHAAASGSSRTEYCNIEGVLCLPRHI